MLILSALSSCADSKEITNLDTGFGAKDYPYIHAFHEGVRLKTKGRVDEAIESFEKCLTIKQDDDAVYYALSQLELMRDNKDASANYIVKAAELDPKNTWYIQELAYMYYDQGLLDKSLENFKKLVELEPRNLDWQYGYAGVLQEAGKNTEAIEMLNRMEDQLGLNPELSIQKYELYMKMNNPTKAIEELDIARNEYPKELSILATLVDHYFKIGQHDKATQILEELVQEDPTNGRAHLALADLYRQKGDTKKAYASLKKAFQSDDVDLNTKIGILTRVQESSYKIDSEVLELVDLLVEMNPGSAAVHSVRGDYYLQLEDNEKALFSYKKALELDQNKFPIWNQVMILEYQLGEYTSLFDHSKACMELFPTMTITYLLHGVSANQLKKFDDAIEALDAGRVLLIDDKRMEAEFWGQKGEAFFGKRLVSDAKQAYKKALELDPGSSLLRSNFAYRLANEKVDLEMAISLAKQAVDGAPNQGQFIDVYGWVYFQSNDYGKALKYFQMANELMPDDAMINDHLGDAYYKQSNVSKALEYWNKAKDLGSKNQALPRKLTDKKYYDPEF